MAQQIKLKAILKAYSKSPLYNDFVRDIYSQSNVSAGTQYVRVYKEILDNDGNASNVYTGEWVPLDTTLLDKSLKEYQEQVKSLENNLDNINVSINLQTNKLKFVDGNGKVYFYELPDSKVDYNTINVNDNYILYVVDTPDGKTLKETDIIYEYMDENNNPLPNEYGIISKKSGKLRVTGIYIEDTDAIISGTELNSRLLKAEKDIRDLENYTQGIGGALDPINLGYLYRLNPDDEGYDPSNAEIRNEKLNNYAYTQLNSNGSNTPIAIPDQTKIQNKYDGILWVYIEKDHYWYNNGADVVVQANNEGVLGVITGSQEKFKAYILDDGTVSINGLQEEFDKVIYDENASVTPDNNTYVKRSLTGQIKAIESIEDDDVINQGQFNKWQEDISVSHNDILSIVNSLYFPEFGDSDGDGDIDIDWAPPTSLDDGVLI